MRIVIAAWIAVVGCTPPAPGAPAPVNDECVVVDDAARTRIVFGAARSGGSLASPARVADAQLHETLIRVDCADRVIAGLAVDWQSADGRDWHFEIRPGASFSDGTPANAQTVAAALATLPVFAGVAATGERELRLTLHAPADVRLFSRRDLAVRRTGSTDVPNGTGAYMLLEPNDRELRIVVRSAPAARDAGAVPWRGPDTITIRPFGADPRAAIDAGVDALVTNDASTLAYARARGGYSVAPLTWSTTYVLATTHRGDSLAEIPAATFPDAVTGATSRPALPPFHLDDCRVPGAGLPAAPHPSREESLDRIVYLRDDRIARPIAERITALARGRAPQWLADRLGTGGAPVAVGVGDAELLEALRTGNARAVVMALPRVVHGCTSDARDPGVLLAGWNVSPLIDVRDDLVYRPGLGRVTMDADGTLRFGDR